MSMSKAEFVRFPLKRPNEVSFLFKHLNTLKRFMKCEPLQLYVTFL